MKGNTMNKEQKQIKKVIDEAFSQLHVLSNIRMYSLAMIFYIFSKSL